MSIHADEAQQSLGWRKINTIIANYIKRSKLNTLQFLTQIFNYSVLR